MIMMLQSSSIMLLNFNYKSLLTMCLKILINDQYFTRKGRIKDYKKEKALTYTGNIYITILTHSENDAL